MNEANFTDFAAGLRGPVIRATDAGYDEARSLYNAMIDKRPMVIARCSDTADVIAAVNFGRANECPSPSVAAATTGPASAALTTGWSSTSPA
jgi:hypothetical protein